VREKRIHLIYFYTKSNYGVNLTTEAKKFSLLTSEMLPERKGNRLHAQLVCEKTKNLGWKETKSIKSSNNKLLRGLNECKTDNIKHY
jgi:hypothetical protein